MIVYFSDRKMNILGQASTNLPKGVMIVDDNKDEDVESGVAVFECEFGFDAATRAKMESYIEVGNFILRKHDNETEFYTIIDSEIDTKKKVAYIYAEDAGLDLLNEIVGSYEADKAYPIDHYIEKFAYDSGFVIGINEAPSLTRKLSWDGEQTVTARLASVATQFDGCEISYTFDIKGLRISGKKINIFKKRGKDIGTTMRLNKEIDNIVIKKTILNVATALRCTGGTPEDTNMEDDVEPVPITLRGYEYDDGDFYVDGDTLKCRSALQKWSRYINPNEQNLKEGHEGHIVRPYSFDTTSQSELCAHAVTELKKLIDAEVNYEADILYLPDNTKIGDRVNIVDEAGELFLSTRLLQLQSSVVRQEQRATLGEFLIKKSGISEKVMALADQFAVESAANRKTMEAAIAAKKAAEEAASKLNDVGDGLISTNQAMGSINQTVVEMTAAVSNAAKTATDFIDQAEDEGVLVGYKDAETGNWGGYRAHIKQDSYTIVDKNGNEVAEYGANNIDLGKNNQDTEISFCGGKSKIKYDAEHDYSRLSADSLVFEGRDTVSSQVKSRTSLGTGLDKEHSNSVAASTDHARMMASRYDVDENGDSVGDIYDSWVTVDGDKAMVGSDTVVHLQAPEIIADGNFSVVGSLFDKYGALIGNGLAAYNGGGDAGIDPDTTLEDLCLTSHSHAPQGSGTFYYIHTAFYNTKSVTAARAQVAMPYNKKGSIYHRHYASGAWSAWTRYMNADEIYPIGSVCIRYDTTSPATLYGGTWQRIEGRFLFGCAESGTVGATGSHTTGSGSSSLPYVNVAIWRRTA